MSRLELLVGPVVSTPYCVCHRKDIDNCMLEKREERRKVCEHEMELVVNAIQKIMKICGFSVTKVEASRNVIMRCFTHYDEIRFRIDRVPHKRLCREDLLHDLGVEADMDRVDCQLVYTIVKRAFRAYYFGTAIHGKRLEKIIKSSYHRQECLWAHAALRTAQVLGKYRGLMNSEQIQYEERMQCVYKTLLNELTKIQMYDDDMVCICNTRLSGMDSAATSIDRDTLAGSQPVNAEVLYAVSKVHQEHHEYQTFLQHQNHSTLSQRTFSKTSVTIKEISVLVSLEKSLQSLQKTSDQEYLCPGILSYEEGEEEAFGEEMGEEEVELHCNCSSLPCVREFDTLAPDLCGDFGQDPYVVRWVPWVEEDRIPPCRPETPPSVCPPCKDSTPCESECECICEYCECDICDQIEEGEEECCKISDEHIEDFDTDFVFVAPLRSRPTSDFIEEEELEVGTDPNAPVKCECICKYKTGIPDPEDMNYVARLRDHKPGEPSTQEEEAVEEEELLEPKKPVLIIKVPTWVPIPDPPEPPPGIRRETMNCWDPSAKSSTISETESELPTPPGLKPASCRCEEVRKRMIEALRAKQPPPRPIGPGPVTLAMALSENRGNMKATITKMPPKPEPVPEPSPNISIMTAHGPSKATASSSRYAEIPPAKRSAGSQTLKQTKTPETPKAPASPPAPEKPATKDSLSKKDIMDILGI